MIFCGPMWKPLVIAALAAVIYLAPEALLIFLAIGWQQHAGHGSTLATLPE